MPTRAACRRTAGYGDDLARIHDAGFGFLAEAAAAVVVQELHRSGFSSGNTDNADNAANSMVVELGCGSGISSRILCDHGFRVFGSDMSPAMIALARKRVPEAEFVESPWLDIELPPCVAVTAIGEVLGYCFDEANCFAALQGLFGRVHRALAAGGLFVFDMPGPDRAPTGSHSSVHESADWTVGVQVTVDTSRTRLMRRITSNVADGRAFRRNVEEHCLLLIEPARITAALESEGFVVEVRHAYGERSLPQGLTAFFARSA
jgi:SAM-dependent methyltransferase